jgi:hypothetical protein
MANLPSYINPFGFRATKQVLAAKLRDFTTMA